MTVSFTSNPYNWEPYPGIKCFHRFRQGTVIYDMVAHGKGLLVATSRGLYWFASLKSKPRKVKA